MRLEIKRPEDETVVQVSLGETDDGAVQLRVHSHSEYWVLVELSGKGCELLPSRPERFGFPLDSKGRIKLVGYEDQRDGPLRLAVGGATLDLRRISEAILTGTTRDQRDQLAHDLTEIIGELEKSMAQTPGPT